MHDISLINGIIGSLLEHAAKHKIAKVYATIGNLKFVPKKNAEELYSQLTKGTPLEGSKLVVKIDKARFNCPSCRNSGELATGDSHHHSVPVYTCKKCGTALDLTGGDDVVITAIEAIKKTNK